VVLEACGGSHHWGRALSAVGHRVRLIPPQYVKPFVKRSKNDRNDAEAISVAASQPSIGSVRIKSVEQQAAAMLLSVRELLVRQRTQLVNALRGHAAELGMVAPPGEKGLAELQTEIAAADDTAVPAAAKQALMLLGQETRRIETRLVAIEAKLMQQYRANPVSRRLSGIPGVGPIGALNFALRIDPAQFRSPDQVRGPAIWPPGSAWFRANARPPVGNVWAASAAPAMSDCGSCWYSGQPRLSDMPSQAGQPPRRGC
jgi:transposase